mmetsp:Transcript_12047/g.30553  ORF Transcript_12047/g.30553 Transcript_12047/m.30553 type:complete len:265 (+) Transcript_12047:301-1095(+)
MEATSSKSMGKTSLCTIENMDPLLISSITSIGGAPFCTTAPIVCTMLGCLSLVTSLISRKRALLMLLTRLRVGDMVVVPTKLLKLLVVESKLRRLLKDPCLLKQERKPNQPPPLLWLHLQLPELMLAVIDIVLRSVESPELWSGSTKAGLGWEASMSLCGDEMPKGLSLYLSLSMLPSPLLSLGPPASRLLALCPLPDRFISWLLAFVARATSVRLTATGVPRKRASITSLVPPVPITFTGSSNSSSDLSITQPNMDLRRCRMM